MNGLGEVGGRHAPTGEFPVKHQQRASARAIRDTDVLSGKVPVDQCPRHRLADIFQLAPRGFQPVEVLDHPVKQRRPVVRQCRVARKVV